MSTPPDLLARVDAWDIDPSATRAGRINTLMELYLNIAALTRRELALIFDSEGERGAICDALNGVVFRPESAHFSAYEIMDFLNEPGVITKWSVDEASMRAKLNSLSVAQRIVLADLVRQWWDKVADGRKITPADLF